MKQVIEQGESVNPAASLPRTEKSQASNRSGNPRNEAEALFRQARNGLLQGMHGMNIISADTYFIGQLAGKVPIPVIVVKSSTVRREDYLAVGREHLTRSYANLTRDRLTHLQELYNMPNRGGPGAVNAELSKLRRLPIGRHGVS